ncbi:pullulanase X25 domain-containing protein [Eshraghiella crossota]|uniref:pullulanase X25 domain-containing protein n=1 Tax=Eshraghiella crossota TaxID=45851 RepID=UPI003F7DFA07
MKKIAKRVITAVLAMAMVIGMMAMTAFAADDTYSVIGSINGNWDKDTDLVKQADGTYSVDITDVKAGSYEFKIRTNHAWDNGEYNLEGDASSGGANAKVDVAKDGSTVTITFDGTKAAVTVKDASAAAPAAPADKTPAAGDSSVMVYIVAAVAALSAVVAVVAKRRSVEA